MPDRSVWRLRVDLFAPFHNAQADPRFLNAIRACVAALGETGNPGVSTDGGTGAVRDRPVLGTLFWVRASTPGEAADLGVRVTAEAFEEAFGAAAELYDVTVIPQGAVVQPDNPHYPKMPD